MHIPKHRDPKLRAEVDRLHDDDGLTFPQIAKALGIGLGTAWRIWHRVKPCKSGHGPSRRFDEVAA